MGLVRDTTEQSARARADRRYGGGRVVSVDRTGHTAMIDVNFVDAQNNAVYIGPIPYQPQSPPSVGDNVTLAYGSADAHSLYIAGGRLSGGNAQSTITTVGGVSSIAAHGDPALSGDVELVAGMNCTLSQAGQQITIDVTIPPVGMVIEVNGAGATTAPRGTLNILNNGGLRISLTDVPGSDRADLSIGSIFGTIPPTKIDHSASPYSVPGGDFLIFADTTAGAITVTLQSPAANTGRVVVVMNTGTNTVTVATAVGSVVGITSITNTSGATAVWYISDGTNWYSMTNSAGN